MQQLMLLRGREMGSQAQRQEPEEDFLARQQISVATKIIVVDQQSAIIRDISSEQGPCLRLSRGSVPSLPLFDSMQLYIYIYIQF